MMLFRDTCAAAIALTDCPASRNGSVGQDYFGGIVALSLAQIAKTLGLSVTTVSRALGGFDDVARGTRARVTAEADRLGYRPNATAQRLRSGRTEAIGVILPNRPGQFDDAFFMRLLGGIGMHLAKRDLDLLVTCAPPGDDEMRVLRRLVEGRRVDGFIIGRTRRRDERIGYLLDRGVPFVAHGRTEETRPYAYLDLDGHAAFAEATGRLIGFGHRRIGLLNAPDRFMFAHYRETGWRAALAAAGLPPGPMRAADPTEENGVRLANEMLALPERPTALLCATDRLAVGALHALTSAGLRVGHDMSLIGHDNLPASCFTSPALTTMDQMMDRAAERLVEILAAVLDGADLATQNELWRSRLLARDSDGPCPIADAQPTRLNTWDISKQISGGRHDREFPPG